MRRGGYLLDQGGNGGPRRKVGSGSRRGLGQMAPRLSPTTPWLLRQPRVRERERRPLVPEEGVEICLVKTIGFKDIRWVHLVEVV